MPDMKRPDPGPPLREGAHWEVRPARGWSMLPEAVACEEKVGRWKRCGNKTRTVVGGKGYCSQHRDWRWVENGRVVEWYMVNDSLRPGPLPWTYAPISGEGNQE